MYRVFVRNKSERRWYELTCRGLPSVPLLSDAPFETRQDAVKALCEYELDVTSPIQTSFDAKRRLYVSEFSVRIEKEL